MARVSEVLSLLLNLLNLSGVIRVKLKVLDIPVELVNLVQVPRVHKLADIVLSTLHLWILVCHRHLLLLPSALIYMGLLLLVAVDLVPV